MRDAAEYMRTSGLTNAQLRRVAMLSNVRLMRRGLSRRQVSALDSVLASEQRARALRRFARQCALAVREERQMRFTI